MLILNYTMKLIVHSLHNINLNMDTLYYIDAAMEKQYYSALMIEGEATLVRQQIGFCARDGAAKKE